MKLAGSQGARIFLTGVTGFVGKVVLEELLRRFDDQELEIVYVLIRSDRKGNLPEERFKTEVEASPCFSKLPIHWKCRVRVISGELSEPGCGISDADRHHLVDRVTHLINCAASVEFDLPVAEAAAANITASLNVLEFARWCTHLKSMVNVSTAYVTPHERDDLPVQEELVPLPRPARQIYHGIIDGKVREKTLLKELRLPNTYTLTKCLSEHLLAERKGDVPLTIVRPSIVSATWRHPFPGWIDSKAAFAGFVSLIGAGYLRAVVAQYPTLLDVVPCDFVANRIIDAAFEGGRGNPKKVTIRHAVSGVANSCNIETCIAVIEDFFRRHRVARYPDLNYVGGKNLKFYWKAFQFHHAPAGMLATWHGLRGQGKHQARVRRLVKQLNYLNTGFPYFTHNTFDFRSSVPLNDPQFEKRNYIETVCRGVYRNLMRRDDTAIIFAGRKYKPEQGDLRRVRRQPQGNFWIRLGAYIVRKGLSRCTDRITFDRPAFEAARKAAPGDNLTVILPTHRSYMDFVLCSYLFFSNPDLGIAIPHIAAAEEFSRIPLLGWLFKQGQAFYVKRGVGREDPALTAQVHRLVDAKQTLEFFIEGTRSRSRKFLKPRRGILRALQATKQTCSILPVTISYDRVPEEEAFMRELKGADKPGMGLMPFLKWVIQMIRGKIDLGRVHITCGPPLTLQPSTDLNLLGRQVIGEFQTGLLTTTHHLRCFLKKNPGVALDLDWLIREIVSRGGRVGESSLGGESSVDPQVETSMRYHWMHLFYPDARSVYPHHAILQNHIVENGFTEFSVGISEKRNHDPRLRRLLRALFEPICRDYALVAKSLGPTTAPPRVKSPQQLVAQCDGAHLPTLEEAFEDLARRRILNRNESGEYQWGERAEDLSQYLEQCVWPEEGMHVAQVG